MHIKQSLKKKKTRKKNKKQHWHKTKTQAIANILVTEGRKQTNKQPKKGPS